MPKPNKPKKAKTDSVPTPSNASVASAEQPAEWTPGKAVVPPRYVVVRNGLRVSDKDYATADDQRATAEKEFWQKVVKRWPDGTRIEVVQYDKKKHRIW